MTYAGIVGVTTPERDLTSLLSLLTGRELAVDDLTSDEARKQAVRDWLTWWEEQGRYGRLNLKALDRYPAGTSQ
jgi:hypothetical protein